MASAAILAQSSQRVLAKQRFRSNLCGAFGAFIVAVVVTTGCRDSKPHEDRAALVVPRSEAKQGGRCVVNNPAAVYTLGEHGRGSAGSEDADEGSASDEQPRELPFSAEVGEALALPSGFAVAALTSLPHAVHAVVALVDERDSSGRTIDLGAVHGAAPPPRFAIGPKRIVIAIADADASGGTVRLAAVDDPAGTARLVWGKELNEGWEASGTFDVAVREAVGVLAWDTTERGSACSRIEAVQFRADTLVPSKPAVMSKRESSAEAPRVVSRPGGFWLAWISRPACGKRSTAQRERGGPRDDDGDRGSVLDLGAGDLEVLRLDSDGSRAGEPVRVTAPRGHVIAYDIVALSDGGALLVFRDDAAPPGAERQPVRLAHVAADGTVERGEVDDEDIGAGVPSLAVDDQSGGGPAVWLALEGATEDTRLGRLSPSGTLIEKLAPEPAVRGGELLSARRDQLLVGMPRGRAVELFVVTCHADKPRLVSR